MVVIDLEHLMQDCEKAFEKMPAHFKYDMSELLSRQNIPKWTFRNGHNNYKRQKGFIDEHYHTEKCQRIGIIKIKNYVAILNLFLLEYNNYIISEKGWHLDQPKKKRHLQKKRNQPVDYLKDIKKTVIYYINKDTNEVNFYTAYTNKFSDALSELLRSRDDLHEFHIIAVEMIP